MNPKELLTKNHSKTLGLHTEIILKAKRQPGSHVVEIDLTEADAAELETLDAEREQLLDIVFPPAPPTPRRLKAKLYDDYTRIWIDEDGNQFADAEGKTPFTPPAPVL